MKIFNEKIFAGMLLLFFSFFAQQSNAASNTVSITRINGMPAKVIEGTTLTNLTYNIHNNSDSETFSLAFPGLQGAGITYTTTCGSLAPSADCGLTLTFVAPMLPPASYNHPFSITGAPSPTIANLSTTIIANPGLITVSANISLSGGASDPTPDTFDIDLTSTTPGGPTYHYTSVPLGTSALSPQVQGGHYIEHISPATVTGGAGTYDAPTDTTVNITSATTLPFVYTLEQNPEVDTDLTMPLVGSATSDVTMAGTAGTFGPHAQGPGSTDFDRMPAGSYTVTATNYVDTNGDTEVAVLSNPYTISSGSHVVSFSFAAKAPTTEHVSTVITAPNLPAGQPVAVTATGTPTYGPHNQAAGTTAFDTMEDGSYTFSAANYTVGSNTYVATISNPVVINGSSTSVAIVYSKVAPGGNYDWHPSRLEDLADDNIFAIFWGGGSTTAPVHISTNPPVNPFLNAQLAAYALDTTPRQSNAAVQNFPNYIAQGSVSEFTPDVTTQMGSQKLDIDFHYEGGGDSSASCAWDNSLGYNVALPAASGSIGTLAAGTYNIIADYYLYSDPPAGFFGKMFNSVTSLFGAPSNGVHYYQGALTITNTSGLNYVVNVVYTETTSAITAAPNLSLVKRVTLPANAVVTYTQTAPHLGSIVTPPHLNLNVDGLCYSVWYESGGYAPQVDNIAAQAAAVKASNSHNLIAGNVFYTTRNSDSFDSIHDDLTNDYSLIFYLYNLMWEAQRMQYQHDQNDVDMVLLINPDSTQVFQGCTQYYCPIIWKAGITQDTVNQLIQIPNLLADVNAAADRMVAKGYLSSGDAATFKALVVSSGILTPPGGSGRTVAGAPEYYLLHNLIVKHFGPNVPFGYGQNIYDNANPLMAVGTPPVANAPWETASVTWLHKVNHLGYSPSVVSQAIAFDAAKYAQFLKDMHYASYAGDPNAAYAPDFIYYDIYERDPIPGEVGSGRVMNGPDLDSYFEYIKDIDALTANQPMAIWQIPGSSLQVQGDTFTGVLAGTWPDYVFGHPTLNNDMSNLATSLGIPAIVFVPYWQTSVYYTNNSHVNNLEDYLKLTSDSP